MRKDNFILFAGCVLIVGGSLVLSKVLFSDEKTNNKPDEVVTTYLGSTEKTYNDSTHYNALTGYTLDYTQDDIIIVNKASKTK